MMHARYQTPTHMQTIQEIKPLSFVFEKHGALSPALCQDMIRRFEDDTESQYAGCIGQQAYADDSIKKSTDLVISGNPVWRDIDKILFQSLGKAIVEFRKTYAFFQGKFKDMGYGLQRTLPGEHYHWHIDGGSHDFSHRQLVAIWYLNDVAGPGGETEFRFQDIRITPQQGKLILFPPFWTHEHRGVTLQAGVKYIATTWVVFA